MNHVLSPSLSAQEGGELVFLGVNKDHDPGCPTAPNLKIRFFQDRISFIRWLKNSKTARPFAILVDYRLLSQHNFQLARQIRHFPTFKRIPLIAVARKGLPVDRLTGLQAGVDDCLDKIEWSHPFVKRLAFLRQFKRIPCQHRQETVICTRIPRMKRTMDILLSGLAILALFPLFLIIALAIKLESRGSVIYRSKRAGMGYQVFDFFKFRSMYTDAENRLLGLRHLNQYKRERDHCFVKLKNDPRITRVGRIIRKTSLDELPQLFNVLRGEMSIVGNRPLPLYEARQLTCDEWAGRFLAPAGITGLWQVTKRGREEMSSAERIHLDLAYAQRYSLFLDLKIILRTFPAMMQHENV